MSITRFIQSQVLLPRLGKKSVLVVYDPDRRYHDLCLSLASEKRLVIDASASSIEGREAALTALLELGQSQPAYEGVIVYVPAPAPRSDEERQRDPFALYAACGALFPDPAYDGDEFLSICLRAKADHSTEIRRIFAENPNPSFAVIDAVGGGSGWPTLQATLDVESARDILFALLAPKPAQQQKLKGKGEQGWLAEAKALFQSSLGLKLLSRATSWSPVAEELWRFLLFSEFVFDLPVPLPPALADVPHASPAAQPLIEDLCDRLRNDQRVQDDYIRRAETIEKELDLAQACREIGDLGQRDTFPFEERSFFAQAVDALAADELDRLRAIRERRRESIWMGRGESQGQWQFVQAATDLLQGCYDAESQLATAGREQNDLIDFYIRVLRDVDRRQREFESHASSYLADTTGLLAQVKEQPRRVYRRLMEKVQARFVSRLEAEGWPPTGWLNNSDLFDRFVSPPLQAGGQRIAFFAIDALRYELGVALHRDLAGTDGAELQVACAPLPSVTPVGMAALLPGAGAELSVQASSGGFVPALGDQSLSNSTQRVELLRRRYGQRFADVRLDEFAKGQATIGEGVELLLLRSNEMDEQFESNPDVALGLISRTFQQIRAAIERLRGLGFHQAVIATDHGFYLNSSPEAGDVCPKPPGTWVTAHQRLLLGDGAADSHNFVLSAPALGIRGDFRQVAGPRGLVAYQAGMTYFHGGASLQELLVPIITLRLRQPQAEATKPPTVTLTYKRGGKKVTTYLPVVEISLGPGDLFSNATTVEILLEAHDKSNQVVGEVRPGPAVNPATRTISLQPGQSAQVTMGLEIDFAGKFTIKALNPTALTAYALLELETDISV